MYGCPQFLEKCTKKNMNWSIAPMDVRFTTNFMKLYIQITYQTDLTRTTNQSNHKAIYMNLSY